MQNNFEKIKEIKKNITLFDFLLLPFTFLRHNIENLFVVRKVIKNWPEIVLYHLGLKKKFIIELRNGKKVKIEKSDDYLNFLRSGDSLIFLLKDARIDKKKKQMKFKYKRHLIRIYIINSGNYKEQLIEEPYKWLNVKGREVVDVGTNVGDTAIYFVVNGAKHIYAFEPYPFSYKIAIKNIKLNKLEEKVSLFNEAVGGENKTIYIDENYENTGSDDLKAFKRGKKIKVVTLEEVVKNFKLKDAVLKMDCEGCEYCSILNTPNEVLRNFEQIMIEYHYGYLNLKKKLEEAGFKVKVSLPNYFFNDRSQNPHMLLGYIYAQRLS